MTRRLLGVLWLACALVLACSKPAPTERVAFSDALRERYRLDDTALRGLQYYISHQLVLERAAGSGTRSVEHGRLILRGGSTIHQVVVPAGTPGWIETGSFVGEDGGRHVAAVSFELGAPLRFAAREPGGAYVLATPKAKQPASFADFFGSAGASRPIEVPFADETWSVTEGTDSYLMIETDALRDLQSKRRVLPGVVGPDSP